VFEITSFTYVDIEWQSQKHTYLFYHGSFFTFFKEYEYHHETGAHLAEPGLMSSTETYQYISASSHSALFQFQYYAESVTEVER